MCSVTALLCEGTLCPTTICSKYSQATSFDKLLFVVNFMPVVIIILNIEVERVLEKCNQGTSSLSSPGTNQRMFCENILSLG